MAAERGAGLSRHSTVGGVVGTGEGTSEAGESFGAAGLGRQAGERVGADGEGYAVGVACVWVAAALEIASHPTRVHRARYAEGTGAPDL